ncbi:MAG: T9SS type A sorting domain-containing protein, partial [Candidatus Marinimicrobia bacterium]|nr:T9SS type A sorting domain-containing protein [Candidatus Neomarinimicrobiota bacterium]MBT7043082.1 T9SS type A sorting domain-containing protein [Candidatus Neomarinimicrobiota bacterium]MBT7514615.1 T9SS type A sorting domain-containing protein [Candidatus Neomarinimicrobiota bacterium]
GLDELEDIQSLRLSMQRVLTPGSYTAVDPENGSLPSEFKLYAAYPNPFNPVATIRFDVGEASHESTLRIFDISGRNVATLISGHLESGTYEVKWDARGFASGVYFSELISGQNRHTQKMVLLK